LKVCAKFYNPRTNPSGRRRGGEEKKKPYNKNLKPYDKPNGGKKKTRREKWKNT
jgi:hypothetical protein